VQITISRVWKRECQSYEDPSIHVFRASPLKKSGQPQKYDRNVVREQAILQVPTHQRKTLRKLAAAIGLSKTTMAQVKDDPDDCVIQPHSNAIKPTLNDHHKFARETNMNLDNENDHI
jgi:hypothetical protein